MMRTTNTGPGSRSFSAAEGAALAARERASRRAMSPAERMKFCWFLIGAVFTTAVYALVVLFVFAAGSPP